jgi:hypothetical protein
MGILDKIKSSHFIINLGITLVLSGLIMVYVKQKFSSYDRQLNYQNGLLKELTHLVKKMQLQSNGIPSLASDGAIDAAKIAHKQFSEKINDNKIKVSDSESSDTDDSESETESESEDEDENDNDSEDTVEIERENKPFQEFSEIKQIIITNSNEGNVLDNLHNLMSVSRPLSIKNMNLENLESLDLDLDNLNEDGIENGSESDSEMSSDSDSDNDNENEDSDNVNKENQSQSMKNMNLNYNEMNINNNSELMSMSSYGSKVVENPNTEEELNQNNENSKLELNHLVDMSKTQLQELCKTKNLSIKGSKKELIDRILNR